MRRLNLFGFVICLKFLDNIEVDVLSAQNVCLALFKKSIRHFLVHLNENNQSDRQIVELKTKSSFTRGLF